MLRSSPNALRKEVEESGTESDHQEQRHKQVFVDEHGNRICFMIHKSIRDPFARGKLERDIERHGGVVLPGDEGVDTVIVDDMRVDREGLQLTYDCHPEESKTDIWVEPMSFIGRCIRHGVVEHHLRRKEGMGGRLIRTAFTAKDEEHLCKYLATRIPEKAAGGRVGLGVYLQMRRMAAANPQTHPWVKRHPPDSWRERYKKNQDRLDEIITHYVEHRRPTEKQKYHRDRRVKRQRPVHSDSDSSQGDVEIIDVTNELREATNTRKDTKSHRRRRSDRDTLPAMRPVKRQRSVPSLDLGAEAEKGVPPVSPPGEGISKGKERALSPDVVEEDLQKHSSLFSEDEFDQPGSSEPGPVFPHNSPSDRIQGALPSSPPCLTQTTLVATIPPSRPQPQPSGPIGSLPEGSLRRASTPPHAPNAEQVNTIPPPPAASGSSPRHRPAVMRMARRHKVADTIEAPYRNTRSRSRSVEPSVLHSQNSTRKLKGKQRQERLVTLASKVLEDEAEVGINDVSAAAQRRKKKRKETVSLEPLQEMLNEDDAIADFRGAARMAISVRDSLLDERDVDFIEEGTTLAPDDIGQISEEVYFDGNSAQRRGSLDADDKQTDDQLRQPPAPSLSQHPRSILHPLMDPQQALQIFNASMPHPTRRPSNAPVLPVAPRPSQIRLSSASSAESYPLTGTRAHTVKESIKEEEKSSPYRPPTGTKAAWYKRV